MKEAGLDGMGSGQQKFVTDSRKSAGKKKHLTNRTCQLLVTDVPLCIPSMLTEKLSTTFLKDLCSN